MNAVSQNYQPSAKPNVRDYLDFREYLRCIYEWRRSSTPGFSYSTWAEELQFKSRSFVRLVVVGKRAMTEHSTIAFTRNLALKKADADYFQLLIKFNQASKHQLRNHYELELMKLRSHSRTDVMDRYHFLSSYLGPRVQVLLSIEDVEKTAENLARLLRVKPAAVQEILETLERIGMAERSVFEVDEGKSAVVWKAKTRDFEVHDNLGNVALQSFHKKSLEEAVSAIDTDPALRKYLSIILPLSTQEFAEANDRMYAEMMAVLEKYKSDFGAGRRLYQINLNLIPITEPLSEARKTGFASEGERSGHFNTKGEQPHAALSVQ